MEPEEFKCCICGKIIKGQYGNNPWPIKDEGKCCDNCNQTVVFQARLNKFIESL